MEKYCNACGQTINESVFRYSMMNFGRALCMNCQGLEKAKRRSSGAVVRGVAPAIIEASTKSETDFTKWTADWRRMRRLNFSLESKHFFLDGMDLDDFAKQSIRMAERTILVANPYVESCYLTDALIDSASKRVEIRIVTRTPEAKDPRKGECHSKLGRMGIILRYDNQIHSKIITIDDKVAIVSSMNFYSGSSGGASKEAGIVSIDEKVVESATRYVRKLLEGPR